MTSSHGLTLWLKRLRLRSALDDIDAAAILALPGQVQRISGSRDFVKMGERVDHACLIVSGLAGRFSQTLGGDRQITAVHIPGDMADLHSVVLSRAATALQGLGDVTIYRVPHDAIKALAMASPALAEAFWRDCVVDAAVLSEWQLVNGRLPALAKVAHLICEMVCRLTAGGQKSTMPLDFPLTQIQLGDATSLTSVHVNRMLRELREQGAVEMKDRQLRVHDWSRLVAIAEFDPAYLHLGKGD